MTPIRRLHLHPAEGGWTLRVDRLETPAWTVTTRERALRAARRDARYHHSHLTVHDRRGRVVRTYDFTGGAS